MEYNKTTYLLSMLYSSANEAQRVGLLERFAEVIPLEEEYQALTKLLETTTFLGPEGVDVRKDSHKALSAALSDIQNAPENVRRMSALVQTISYESTRAEGLLKSPRYFDDDFWAIPSSYVDRYRRFYDALANSICYYLLSQFGVDAIRNLTFNKQAKLQDIVRLVNHQYSNELAMSAERQKPTAWAILDASYTGDNLIHYDGYRLGHLDYTLQDMLKRTSLGEFKRVSPYLFSRTSSSTEILYMGFGNVIGVACMESLSILGSDLITSLPLDCFGSRQLDLADPLVAIREALNSKAFCIPPSNLVAALDRWALTKTVNSRRRHEKCIFCGVDVDYGIISCDDHFFLGQ